MQIFCSGVFAQFMHMYIRGTQGVQQQLKRNKEVAWKKGYQSMNINYQTS